MSLNPHLVSISPIVRPAISLDLSDIKDLFQESIRGISDTIYSTLQKEMWISKGLKSSQWKRRILEDVFFLATVEENLMGFISLTQKGYLDLLYVHPKAQGQGVGKLLLRSLDDHIREWELDHIRTDASLASRPFFESQGFVCESQENIQIEREFLTRFRMVRTIPR